MIHSMTAFASRTGGHAGASWVWEVRSVNARGLDLRLRLPEGIDGLEADVRRQFGAALKRGSISLTLRMTQDGSDAGLSLNETQLDRVLVALDQIQERAFAMGVTLAQPTAADVLAQRGVIVQGAGDVPDPDIIQSLKADIAPLLLDLRDMRAREGKVLHAVIAKQVDEVATLIEQAERAVQDRQPKAAEALQAAMARVLAETAVDPDRMMQELAVLSVKTDVTEEIDRLKGHVAAARDLLDVAERSDQPVGRKFDFLSQEFNREANTLCAKAQHAGLTKIGLSLKTVIDQMREQIQNVE